MRSTLSPLLPVLLFLPASCGDSSEPDSTGARATRDSWFHEVTGSGIDFRHDSDVRGRLLLPEIMGGGAALFDCDGDGDLDLYCVNGRPDSAAKSALYTNDGTGKFTNVTAGSGVAEPGYGMGVAVGDFDNDGQDDLYVSCVGEDRLYRSLGAGKFEDVTEAAGIVVPKWSCSAAFLDFDRDGFLDLYVTQYVDFDEKECKGPAGEIDYCGPLVFDALPDALLRNRGDGTFEDVSAAAGIQAVAAAGLGVVCEDFDGDGWVDVYVANDGYQNHLWINGKNGTFRDDALMQGVALNFHGRPEAGMGVVAEDLSGDGVTDLFLTHLLEESNSFYMNLGEYRGFVDATGRAGLAASSVQWTGFGVCAFDAELDGDLDLVVANGRVRRRAPHASSVVAPPLDLLAEPNLFYRNGGAGNFTQESASEAELCGPADVSRGLVQGDIDLDGDIDLVMTHIMGTVRLFKNEAPRAGSWLVVDAALPELRRRALGAVVTLSAGSETWTRTIRAASGYLTSQDPRAHFGIPAAVSAGDATLTVRWPDGKRELFPVSSFDTLMTLARGAGEELP